MNKFYTVMKKIFGTICKYLFRVKVISPEKEITDRPYILCCNHTSFFDVVAISVAMKTQISYLAKKELFKVPLLRWFIKSMGAIPVDRKSGDVGAIKKMIHTLKDGGCVGIFPQGKRYPKVDPKTTPVKDGLGMVANRAKVDILPVYIKSRIGKVRPFRRNYVIIGDPIPFEEIDFSENGNEKYKKISEYAFSKCCALADTEVKKK